LSNEALLLLFAVNVGEEFRHVIHVRNVIRITAV
jgi:hypothetical protein